MEKELQLEHMTLCIQGLPNEQQQCIELFYLQNKSYNEIVDITGFDWKSVRSYIQNGRRNLKICMDKQDGKAQETRPVRPDHPGGQKAQEENAKVDGLRFDV